MPAPAWPARPGSAQLAAATLPDRWRHPPARAQRSWRLCASPARTPARCTFVHLSICATPPQPPGPARPARPPPPRHRPASQPSPHAPPSSASDARSEHQWSVASGQLRSLACQPGPSGPRRRPRRHPSTRHPPAQPGPPSAAHIQMYICPSAHLSHRARPPRPARKKVLQLQFCRCSSSRPFAALRGQKMLPLTWQFFAALRGQKMFASLDACQRQWSVASGERSLNCGQPDVQRPGDLN